MVLAVLFCFALYTFAQPDTLWTRVIGEYGFRDGAADVQQTSDGGFIVTGGSASFGAALPDTTPSPGMHPTYIPASTSHNSKATTMSNASKRC